MRSIVLTCLFCAMPGLAAADYCTDRAEAALADLGGVLQPSADGASSTVARDVLVRVCRDAQGQAAGVGESTPSSAAASASVDAPVTQAGDAEKGASTRVFGIEIKEAPAGAAGYERARKSP